MVEHSTSVLLTLPTSLRKKCFILGLGPDHEDVLPLTFDAMRYTDLILLRENASTAFSSSCPTTLTCFFGDIICLLCFLVICLVVWCTLVPVQEKLFLLSAMSCQSSFPGVWYLRTSHPAVLIASISWSHQSV